MPNPHNLRGPITLKEPEPGTPRYKFLEWLLIPERERQPRTQSDFAREQDINIGDLSRWKKEPGFKRALEKRADELFLDSERINAVMQALWKEAEKGDVQATRLYLQHAQELKPRRVVLEDPEVQKMSDVELVAELQEHLGALVATGE